MLSCGGSWYGIMANASAVGTWVQRAHGFSEAGLSGRKELFRSYEYISLFLQVLRVFRSDF